MKRIGILTSGGDAPGMNAAIRAATRTGAAHGVEVIGIRRGYAGLINSEFIPLSPRDVGGIIELGGTFLESARCPDFHKADCRAIAVANLRAAHIDGLIAIGGNGTQTGAAHLSSEGVCVNGVASTIDNDLFGSELTIGVDTALNVALETIDRLRTTASSHHRLFIIEVMGRDCGYLALTAGIAGGAEAIVMPENEMSPEMVLETIRGAHARGKRHALVVVAEGSRCDGQALYQYICQHPEAGFDPRLSILGHVQRGARPTAFDRLLATRLAARATDLLLHNQHGYLVGLLKGHATPTLYSEVIGKAHPLPDELVTLADYMQL
jgi:6-phosphofructokinase 1